MLFKFVCPADGVIVYRHYDGKRCSRNTHNKFLVDWMSLHVYLFIVDEDKINFKTFSYSCSYLPWFEIYYKLLNTLADYLTKQQVIISLLCIVLCLQYTVPCKYITWKIRCGLIWVRNKLRLVLKLHCGELFSSVPFFCMLHVVFCVQVLFAVLGSTWLLLLAATMLTFHRPNADLTLEVIPDDLLQNKSLRKQKKQRTHAHTHAHTHIRTQTEMFAPHKSLFPWLFTALY